MACVGCVPIAIRGGCPNILLAELRWTRSGLKAIMHILNGCDQKINNAREAARNCTDEELSLVQQGVDALWSNILIPQSWKIKGPDTLGIAHQLFPNVRVAVMEEGSRRRLGGECLRDQLSLARFVIPKGRRERDEEEWLGALRELSEEIGVPTCDVSRVEWTPRMVGGSRGDLVAFTVRLSPQWEALREWQTPSSSETKGARWFTAEDVHQIFLPRAMRDIVLQVFPMLDHMAVPRSSSPTAARGATTDSESKAILAIPKGVVNGSVEFSEDDLFNIVRHADLPDKSSVEKELVHWSTCSEILAAIQDPEQDTRTHEFVNKGDLYSKGALTLMFYALRNGDADQAIGRRHLCHLAGSIKRLFEQQNNDYDATVGIEYAEERNPITGDSSCSRRYEQVGFDDILDNRLQSFTGSIENVRFTGAIKAATDIPYSRQQNPRPRGLCLPVVVGVFAATGRDESWEPPADRAARMLRQCSEGRSMAAARNLMSMLNKPKMIAEYRADRKSFPRVKNLQALTRNIDNIKTIIRENLEWSDRVAALCSLLETSLSTIPDDGLEAYCRDHFLLQSMNKGVIEKAIAQAHYYLDKLGKLKLTTCRSMIQDVLPVAVASVVLDCTDGVLPSGKWRWTVSHDERSGGRDVGIKIVEVHGSHEVEIIHFKRASTRALLKNIGFVVDIDGVETDLSALGPDVHLAQLDLQWSSDLTPNQRFLKDLAHEMCFHTRSQPFPAPSVSPDFVNGAIVFVDPAVARDLPEMVRACERRGYRVGMGVMFCSKKYFDEVMSALDPKRMMASSGAIVQTKSTAFTKIDSRVTLELPSIPSTSARKMIAEKNRDDSRPNFISDPGASFSGLEMCSIGTRQTRSTGDLPHKPSQARPNACDRPYRQPLPASIREGKVYEKKELHRRSDPILEDGTSNDTGQSFPKYGKESQARKGNGRGTGGAAASSHSGWHGSLESWYVADKWWYEAQWDDNQDPGWRQTHWWESW